MTMGVDLVLFYYVYPYEVFFSTSKQYHGFRSQKLKILNFILFLVFLTCIHIGEAILTILSFFFDKIFKIFLIIFSKIRYINYFKFATDVGADTLNLLLFLLFDVFSCNIYTKNWRSEIFVRSFRIYVIYQI